MAISEVYNEDCMLMMARYPDKFFDLAIVDPPYGIGEDGRNNHTRSTKGIKVKDYRGYSRYDNDAPPVEYFFELSRVSKNQIIWGANHFISRMPFDSSAWIVWDKNNGASDFSDCELAFTSFGSAVRKFKYTWNGMLQEDMKNKEFRVHPNQKPRQLYRWILDNYAKCGDKILDTHMGSQSSRIAAALMGFDYYGCEIDERYFNDGNKRFELLTAQQQLF